MSKSRPLLPTRWGLPFGFVLTGAAGASVGHAHPDLALLAVIAVVDVVAMVTTVPAVLVAATVGWVVDAGWVLGGPLVTARSERDGAVLVLVALTAWGFASLLRAGRDHHESQLACIPTQRQEDPVTSSVP